VAGPAKTLALSGRSVENDARDQVGCPDDFVVFGKLLIQGVEQPGDKASSSGVHNQPRQSRADCQ
jgi:hypothetical protein